MTHSTLQVHPEDDMIVALRDHQQGEVVGCDGQHVTLTARVAAKHKFARRNVSKGELLRMYGMVVGRATQDIAIGEPLTTTNLEHATDRVQATAGLHTWQAPDVSNWQDRRFQGFVREDHRVGTRNHWIVVPLVFCENRNIQVMSEAMLDELGYGRENHYRQMTRQLVSLQHAGAAPSAIVEAAWELAPVTQTQRRVFPQRRRNQVPAA